MLWCDALARVHISVRKAKQYQIIMRIVAYSGWVLAAALAAAPIIAQDAPQSDSEIIVERERMVDIRAAGEVAKQVAGRPRSREPLARFNAPFCLGLAIDDADRGRLIGRRIIANARTAGLKIGKPGCRTNAVVIIADDVRGMIDKRRRSGKGFYVRMKRHQIDRVLRQSRDPAYVFHDILVTAGERGRISRNTRKDMISAVMLIEYGEAMRFTPEQVADYASLRLLAPTQEMDELAKGTPRTIMTLFAAPDTAPPEMTRIDRAYLAALYRLRTNATAIEVLLAAARSIAGESTRRR